MLKDEAYSTTLAPRRGSIAASNFVEAIILRHMASISRLGVTNGERQNGEVPTDVDVALNPALDSW